MSAAAAQAPAIKFTERRTTPRHTLAVLIDVNLLRSGIPDRVPARMLNLGECGLAMIAAADLRCGDFVGVEFRLDWNSSPMILKARVRYQALLRYGIEFLNLSDEQRARLRYFFDKQPDPSADLIPIAAIPQIEEKSQSTSAQMPVRSALRRLAIIRWSWMALVLFLLIGGVGWWRWYRAWSDLEARLTTNPARPSAPFNISEDTAERLLTHRVDPTYPDAARRANVEGSVAIDVVIAADGKVQDAQMISGSPMLGAPAVDAVKLWQFRPYRVNGQSVAVETTLHVDVQP